MSKICKKRVHGNDKKIYLETLKSVLGRSILHYWHETHYLFSDIDPVTATFHVLVNIYFHNFRLVVHLIYLVVLTTCQFLTFLFLISNSKSFIKFTYYLHISKVSPQILSIKGDCTFLLSSFLIIVLCNSSANALIYMFLFLILLPEVFVIKTQQYLIFSNIKCFNTQHFIRSCSSS